MGRRVEAMRPTRKILGAQLNNYIIRFEDILRLAVLTQAKEEGERSGYDDNFDSDAWRPAQRSPASHERQLLIEAGWPPDFLSYGWHQDYSRTLSVVRRLTEAATDNLKAISILLGTPQITRGPLVLGRAVLDAAAHNCYLLEPDIDSSERFARSLNEELSLSFASYKVAVREGDAAEISTFETEARQIEAVTTALGYVNFIRARGTGSHRPVRNIGDEVLTAEMIDRALDSPGPIWNGLSAIVHNQEDMGFRLVFGLESAGVSPHRDSYIALQVLPALLAFVYARKRLEAYTSWDFMGLGEVEGMLLELWAHGSGIHDDEYRRVAEAETCE